MAPRNCVKGVDHPDLTANDRQQVDAFARYLVMIAQAPSYIVNGREVYFVSHFWMTYAKGGPAPPLMWEGDNA